MASGKELNTTKKEMREVFGVSIMMGNLKFPWISMYWGSSNRVKLIPDKINQNRIFKFRSNLHVVSQYNPGSENNDQLWKLKPVIEAASKHCRELPPEKNNSINEKMIPFKGRIPAKQFIKNKLNLAGFTRLLGGLIAMRLSNIISRKQNLKLFFDNCFTNMELIKIRLRKENGIYISFWCCETLSHGRLR